MPSEIKADRTVWATVVPMEFRASFDFACQSCQAGIVSWEQVFDEEPKFPLMVLGVRCDSCPNTYTVEVRKT